MSRWIRKHPALSLFLLAVILGLTPVMLVAVKVLPSEYMQLGALSASAAGIILTFIEGRPGSTRQLLARVLVWRAGLGWWLYALLFPFLMAAGAISLAALFGGEPVAWGSLKPLSSIFPLLLLYIVLAGFGQEFGWRGFAIPRLQNRYNALTTSLIVGIYHTLWHTPLFFMDGLSWSNQAIQMGLLPAVLITAITVINTAIQLTWIFNNTRGSVLLVAVAHGASGAWYSFLGFRSDQIPSVYANAILMTLVSVIIILVFGAKNFSRKNERIALAKSSQPILQRAAGES
jgi:membrane protease YdiL (CAAX protease family)